MMYVTRLAQHSSNWLAELARRRRSINANRMRCVRMSQSQAIKGVFMEIRRILSGATE